MSSVPTPCSATLMPLPARLLAAFASICGATVWPNAFRAASSNMTVLPLVIIAPVTLVLESAPSCRTVNRPLSV